MSNWKLVSLEPGFIFIVASILKRLKISLDYLAEKHLMVTTPVGGLCHDI